MLQNEFTAALIHRCTVAIIVLATASVIGHKTAAMIGTLAAILPGNGRAGSGAMTTHSGLHLMSAEGLISDTDSAAATESNRSDGLGIDTAPASDVPSSAALASNINVAN